MDTMNTVPTLRRQKTYIIENAEVLDANSISIIRQLVQNSSFDHAGSGVPPIVDSDSGETSINLDALSPSIVTNIYFIVHHRRETLNEPAAQGKT